MERLRRCRSGQCQDHDHPLLIVDESRHQWTQSAGTASTRRGNSRRLDALRATSKALKSLYAALSDAQKETANQLRPA
jgi:hypothetical protein